MIKFIEIEATAFDDYTLQPAFTNIRPDEQISLETKLTKNIFLKLPLVSSPMTDVTNSKLAVALELEGGMAFLPASLPALEQALEAGKIKRFESGFVKEPVTIAPNKKISDVYAIKQKLGYSHIPVTEDGTPNGKLVGIITSRDYFITEHDNDLVSAHMTKDSICARVGISLLDANKKLIDEKLTMLPIVDKGGRLDSIVHRSDLEKNLDFPIATKDTITKKLLVGVAVFPNLDDLKIRIPLLEKEGVDVYLIDQSQGFSAKVADAIKYIKKETGKEVVAGNVVTKEGAEYLISAGADALRVGMGVGSICITADITGVSMPQLTAILETAQGAGDIPIIADGGIRYSGDIVKALAAGASVVMAGSLFASTAEAPNELRTDPARDYKIYRGEGCKELIKQRRGQRYYKKPGMAVAEGVLGAIPYSGTVSELVFQLRGGLEKALYNFGARNIQELREKAVFRKQSVKAKEESKPRVQILNYPSNYKSTD